MMILAGIVSMMMMILMMTVVRLALLVAVVAARVAIWQIVGLPFPLLHSS